MNEELIAQLAEACEKILRPAVAPAPWQTMNRLMDFLTVANPVNVEKLVNALNTANDDAQVLNCAINFAVDEAPRRALDGLIWLREWQCGDEQCMADLKAWMNRS